MSEKGRADSTAPAAQGPGGVSTFPAGFSEAGSTPASDSNDDERRWWVQVGIGEFKVPALYDPGAIDNERVRPADRERNQSRAAAKQWSESACNR